MAKMTNTKDLLRWLQAVNSEYQNQIEDMCLFRQTYRGGREYIRGGNLFRHGRENEADYGKRLLRAYFENFCAPIVNLYAGFISNSSIKRTGLTGENFEGFMKDSSIEKSRKPYQSFISELISWAATQGTSYAIVDRPRPGANVQTKAQELELGIRTFVRRIEKERILDWAFDENGEYEWIKIREESIDPRPSFMADSQKTEVYRIWSKVDWTIYHVDAKKKTATMADQGPNPIGKVPIVEMEWPEGSLIRDAAHVNRGIFNWSSLLDEILYRLTFPQLLLPGDEGSKGAERKLGTATALTFDPKNPAAKPEFINASSEPADCLMKQIENGITAIKRMLLFKSVTEGNNPESGIAKAYEFDQLNSVLIQASQSVQSADEAILKLWADWENVSAAELKVEYPSEFNVRALEAQIENTIKTQAANLGKEFDRYMKKKLAQVVVDPRDTQDLKKIVNEIDSGAADASIPSAGLFDETGKPIKEEPEMGEGEEEEGAEGEEAEGE